MSNPAPLLTDDSIAFLNGRVSIIAAASSIDLEPLLVRCTGCSIDSDRRVTLFLAASHAGALLAATWKVLSPAQRTLRVVVLLVLLVITVELVVKIPTR